MNQEKAREYFSGYYEGTLERGLRQTLEQRMRTDAQLQAEYRAFERTMDHLDMLKYETIEVPSYLSDRIATRIEEAQASVKRTNPLVLWLPRFAIGGLAAAALLFGAINIFNPGKGPSESSVITTPGISAPVPLAGVVTVTTEGHSVKVSYQSSTPHTVVITDGQGQSGSYQLLANQPFGMGLKNPNAQATMFEVKVSDGGTDEFIAVPGTAPQPNASDSGTVADFAKVLADKFNSPVVLKVQDPSKAMSWDLDSDSAMATAQKYLDSGSFDVTLSATKVLTISSK